MSKLGFPLQLGLLASPHKDLAGEQAEPEGNMVDMGIIRCICNSSDDDGFTIQCERCLVWQHAYCVKISQNNIPDHYLCDKCSQLYPNLKRSMDMQNQRNGFARLHDDSRKQDLTTAEKKRTPLSADQLVNKRKSDKTKNKIVKRSREGQDGYPSARPTDKKPKMSKRITMSKQTLKDLESDEDMFSKVKLGRGGGKDLAQVPRSVIRCKFVRQIFREAMERWSQLNRWRGPLWRDDRPSSLTGPFITMETSTLLQSNVRPLFASKSTGPLSTSKDADSQGIFATAFLSANRFVAEVIGNVMLKSEYKFDMANDYVVMGTAKVGVLFYPSLDLCVDGRHDGNDLCRIRRSCRPNAELRNIVLPRAKDDHTVHLGLFTSDDIEKGGEVTIGWSWQKGHIAWRKNIEWHQRHAGVDDGHQVIDEEVERRKRHAVFCMLDQLEAEFGGCACQDRNTCLIEYLQTECGPRESTAVDDASSSPKDLNAPQTDTTHVPIPPSSGQRVLVKTEHTSTAGDSLPARDTSPTLPLSRTQRASKKSQLGGDDSMVIDVISTSPRTETTSVGRGAGSDGEEELDIDGDIDVGEELPSVVPTSPADASSSDDENEIPTTSSLSNLSDDEDAFSDADDETKRPGGRKGPPSKKTAAFRGQRTKPKTIVHDPNDALAAKSKTPALPLKKMWMREYMQVADKPSEPPSSETDTAPVSISDAATDIDKTKTEPSITHSDSVIADLQEHDDATTKSAVMATVANESMVAQSDVLAEPKPYDDTLDEGEMSDASSASTLPLDDPDHQDIDEDADA